MEMKALLYAAVEQAPAADITESHILERYFNKFDEQFFHYCDKELAKINTFYSEKLAEATRRFATLNNELSEILSVSEDRQGNRKIRYRNNILHKKPVSARKLQELKLAFSEFYLFLILLQNYQNLNFTGFRKILKKHDKLLNIDIGAKWRAEHVDTALFHTHKDIDRLIAETEALVTRDLEHGDRQRAMKRLRVPPLGEQLSPWITFKVGLFSGAFVVLLIAVILSGAQYRNNNNWRVLCRLYRGPLLMIQFLFLMGINVYGWRSSGVNHVLIFELDPRNHLSEQHIIEMASVFGLVWSLSILGFLYSETLGIPPFVQPILLYTLLAVFLFNPTKTLRYEARFWALRVLGRIFCAPFFYVGFADFWLADQLNSLHTVFLDFQYFVCFYVQNSSWTDVTDAETCIMRELSMRPFVACLPAWFRFAQCLRRYRDTKEAFPHLANAAKYATSFFVVVFSYLHLTNSKYYVMSTENPYFYLWITASIMSSCFAYTWDVKLDWGLFDSNAGENKFLREEIVYSSPVSTIPCMQIKIVYLCYNHVAVLLLLCNNRRFCAPVWLGIFFIPYGDGICSCRFNGFYSRTTGSVQNVVKKIRSRHEFAWSAATTIKRLFHDRRSRRNGIDSERRTRKQEFQEKGKKRWFSSTTISRWKG
ncbi:solute carrier family 53 member 1 isoform X4 [Megachile rotundata]|uniref:solute carrier family 53 member 1 isoform X4 n=1 Tax=Megachile rotundata TaxID=143995 RepID=UPI000614E6B6|nr:PREDICTED: xenotropic and polytropic retrovirus receptor 1-like isoform X4 [Megachile rotundata]